MLFFEVTGSNLCEIKSNIPTVTCGTSAHFGVVIGSSLGPGLHCVITWSVEMVPTAAMSGAHLNS